MSKWVRIFNCGWYFGCSMERRGLLYTQILLLHNFFLILHDISPFSGATEEVLQKSKTGGITSSTTKQTHVLQYITLEFSVDFGHD